MSKKPSRTKPAAPQGEPQLDAIQPEAPQVEPKPARKPAAKSEPKSAPGRCINCGQSSKPIEIMPPGELTASGYRCPMCKHFWTDEQERAPFRRVQRGEK